MIVGAGYAGLSAALALAGGGARVVLLEAAAPGAQASGRNAAGLAGIWAGPDSAGIERMFGTDRGRRMNAMVARSPMLVRDLIRRHGLAADLRMQGMLIGAHDAAATGRLQAAARHWTGLGNPMDWLEAPAFAAAAGTDRYHGGLFLRSAGTLNPLAFARGLARAADASGVSIFCNSPVTAIEATGHGWRVMTTQGAAMASQVLLTAGTGTARIWPALQSCYYQLPMAVVASASLDDVEARRLSPRGLPLAGSNSLDLFWMMQTADRRIVGSLFPTVRKGLPPAAVAAPYVARIRRLFPDAPGIHWTLAWTGVIDLLPRRVPQVLRLAPGLHAILGFSGQGINLATALGHETASYLLSGDPDRLAFPIEAPHKLPLSRALPFLMRHVVFPLLRAKARLG